MDSLEATVVEFARAAALSPEDAWAILTRAVEEFELTDPCPTASVMADV